MVLVIPRTVMRTSRLRNEDDCPSRDATCWLMRFALGLLVLGLCWLTACATPPHRARQYQQAFDAMPVETQLRVSRGVIRVGDTREAVYIAMGEPQNRETRVNEGGVHEDHWIYVGRPLMPDGLMGEGDYAFVTVNDFSRESVFARAPKDRIHAVFMGEMLVRVELLASTGEPITQPFPRMTMPSHL